VYGYCQANAFNLHLIVGHRPLTENGPLAGTAALIALLGRNRLRHPDKITLAVSSRPVRASRSVCALRNPQLGAQYL
jgi:hypothetical protein